MIPLFATVQMSGWKIRIWIPIFLIWLILLPFAILIFPFFALICLVCLVNPLKAVKIFWEILSSFVGTTIDVESGDDKFFIKIF